MRAWLIIALAWLANFWLSTESRAQAASTSRQAIIEKFVEQRQKNPAIYQSPPITHIVPNFNTFTYAGNVEYESSTLYPSDGNGKVTNTPTSSTSLKLSGYGLSPHLAMSLKRVGLGFSVESAHHEALYTNTRAIFSAGSETPGAASSEDLAIGSATDTQKSTLDVSGYGFNVSLLPLPKLTKTIKLATILGIKSLNAKHSIGPTRYQQTLPTGIEVEDTLYRYNVQKYEVGVNLSIQLLKGFRIIPWVAYTETAIQNNEEIKAATSSTNCTDYECDLQLFWNNAPKLRYGVDVGLFVGGFEVRIGGLLGTLGNLNTTPAFIDDDSVMISLSWDQKGG